jgi:TolC family type I secretion outer membrane protein
MSKNWKKSMAPLAAASLFLLNTAVAWAAPVDVTLADSIAAALQNNPSIKIADADKEKAKWNISEAKGAKLPGLSLGSSFTESGGGPGSSSTSDSWANSVRLNWQLYSGGRVENQISQSELGLKIADLGTDKAKQQLRLDTTVAYYTVLQARNSVQVNQETVASLRQHLANVQAKYQVGTVAKSDVLRSEVELANAEQNLTKVQNSLDLAVVGLNNLMGFAQDTELALKDELLETADTRTLEECIREALADRPEIKQAEAGITVAQKGIDIARSNNRPSVNLSGSNGWNDSLVPDNGDSHWSASLSASWNLFDGGVTKARVNAADAALQKSNEQARQIRDSVQTEVRQAYLSVQEAAKRIETTKTAVVKAEEDLNISQVKYYAGAGTNIEVIDAQLALTQAKTNYTQALYDYNVGKAKLDRAVSKEIG